MVEAIPDHWENYSREGFTLRKSLLLDHVNSYQTEDNDPKFAQVIEKF